MKQVITRALFAYWDEIRGDRLAPERADIDPAGIRALLGNVFMLEVDGAGQFPFRLCGAFINALFLRELRGSSFLDLWRSAEQTDIAALLHSVLDNTAPLVVGAVAGPSERLAIDLELLLLPLRHHGKTHARILGALVPSAQSSWFGLIAAEALALRSIRILAPSEPADTAASPSARAAKLPGAVDATTWRTVTRRLQLTVHSGGQR